MSQKLKKYIDPKGRNYSNLYRDEVNEMFYVRDRSLGKISLETTDPKVAIPKILTAMATLKARKNKHLVRENENVLWRDIYQKMIDLKKVDDTKESTLRRVDTVWKNSIEPYWGDLEPKSLNQEQVDDFKVWHRKRKPGRQLVNVFKYLGNMFRIGSEYGYLTNQAIPRLELPKDEQKQHATKKGRFITYEEFEDVAGHMEGRFLLIAKIAYFMGMRKMEIGSLECDRVIEDGGNVFIDLSAFDTKTGIPRTIPVPEFLAPELLSLKLASSKYIFPMGRNENKHIPSQTIDRAWRDAKERAKSVKGRVRFHDLRHTAATNMARAQVNPVLAVTYLGMSLATYQKTYLKLQKEDLLIISKSADKLFGKGSSK